MEKALKKHVKRTSKDKGKTFVTEGMENYLEIYDNRTNEPLHSFPTECFPENKRSEFRKNKSGRSNVNISTTREELSKNIMDKMAESYEEKTQRGHFDSKELEINTLNLDLDFDTDTEQDINSETVQTPTSENLFDSIDFNQDFETSNNPQEVKQKSGISGIISNLLGGEKPKKEKPKKQPKAEKERPPKKERPIKKERPRVEKPKKERPSKKEKPRIEKKPRLVEDNISPNNHQMNHQEEGEVLELNPDLLKMLNSQTYRPDTPIVNKNELVDRGENQNG